MGVYGGTPENDLSLSSLLDLFTFIKHNHSGSSSYDSFLLKNTGDRWVDLICQDKGLPIKIRLHFSVSITSNNTSVMIISCYRAKGEEGPYDF